MTIRAYQRGLTREVSYDQYLQEKPVELDINWYSPVSSNELKDTFALDVLEDVLEGVSTIVAGLQTALEFVTAAVDYIVVVLGRTVINAAEALIIAIKEALEAFLNLLEGASFNTLVHFPQSYKSRRRPSEILYDVGMAYLDEKDAKRPLMVDDVFAYVLVGIWSAPNLESLMRQFDSVVKNLRSIGAMVENDTTGALSRFSKWDEDWRTPNKEVGTSGMAPDFNFANKGLAEIKPIKELADKVRTLIKYADISRKFAQQISSVLSLAQSRLTNITNITNTILATINSAVAMLTFEGANGLFLVNGTGEAKDFSKAIINSPLHPKYPENDLFEEVSENLATRGVLAPLDRDLGERGLFSGAVLLHFQVPNVAENVTSLGNLIKALYKEFETTTKENHRTKAKRLASVGDVEEQLNERRN